MRALIAVLLIIGGIVCVFLPILGFWMVPLGLALLAIDLPFLRGPLARVAGLYQPEACAAGGLSVGSDVAHHLIFS